MPHNLTELTQINYELIKEISERKKAEALLEKKNKLLSNLLEVSNLVSSTLEIKPLLGAILDKLKSNIDYCGAKIFIIDGDVVNVVAHRSRMTEHEAQEYSFKYKLTQLGSEVIFGKVPYVIDDIQLDSPKSRNFREVLAKQLDTMFLGMHAWVGIPMIVKDKSIGVLSMVHCEPGYFQPHHIELGVAFANQAAIEYENVRLYNEALKRTDELKTMLSIQQAITSRLDLDSVLKLIADEARRLTKAFSTAVLLVEGSDLVISVFSGDDPLNTLGYRLPIETSMLGRQLMAGKSAIFRNSADNPEAHQYMLNKIGAKMYLIVPLMAGTKPVGLISVTNAIENEFSSEDERILNMFASSAVIGIENARMYEEEKRRHQEDEQRRYVAEGLRDILAVLNSNRPLEEVLDFIIKQAVRIVGTDSGALFSLDKEKNLLTLDAACGLPESFLEHTVLPLGSGAIGRAVIERRPIVFSDIPEVVSRFIDLKELNTQFNWLSDNCNGILALPLICKNEVYGGIALYFKYKDCNDKNRSFSNYEIELAMTFADQAALAIENAVLRAHAQENAVAAERSRLARDLHDAVTQTLFSSSLIAEVLPRIWDRNPEEGKKRLEEIRQLTRGALAEMRTLLLELRPATLVEANLDELLKQLSEATTGRARVPVKLKLDVKLVLPVDVKIAFYRIAQEALNNIAKHSGASESSVTLRKNINTKEALELIISDNGKGFDPDYITGEHLGIGIMKERADAIGASLIVESQLGKGTDIIINWEIV